MEEIMLTLYHNDMSTCAQKVRCQLAEKNLAWEGIALNLRMGEQHQPAFLKLNPKGVVPVLVHNGTVVTESNIILEYVEDAFPEAISLMPGSPAGRARVRFWLQRLDSGLHLDIAVISIGVAFREQLLAVHNTPAALEAYFAAMPDPALRAVYQDVVPLGVESAQFGRAIAAWMKMLIDIEYQLSSNPYLAGDRLSIADFGILPYLCRLEHLQLESMWIDLPHVQQWFDRMLETSGYKGGIEAWLNPKYLVLMQERGAAIRDRTDRLIDDLSKNWKTKSSPA
jgi:glutathione S-transferase